MVDLLSFPTTLRFVKPMVSLTLKKLSGVMELIQILFIIDIVQSRLRLWLHHLIVWLGVSMSTPKYRLLISWVVPNYLLQAMAPNFCESLIYLKIFATIGVTAMLTKSQSYGKMAPKMEAQKSLITEFGTTKVQW